MKIASDWRRENGYIGRGGVVIVFGGEVAGWCDELRTPEHWEPGCIAVDEAGNQWVATGGNPNDGARRWQSIQQAA